MKIEVGSNITAGERLRGGDMITLAHKTSDYNCPVPQEEDEMVCVRIKNFDDEPIGVYGIMEGVFEEPEK